MEVFSLKVWADETSGIYPRHLWTALKAYSCNLLQPHIHILLSCDTRNHVHNLQPSEAAIAPTLSPMSV